MDGIAEDRLHRAVRRGEPPDDDPAVAEEGLRYARRLRLGAFGTGVPLIPLFVAVVVMTMDEERLWLRWLMWVLLGALTTFHGIVAPVLAQRNVRRARKALLRAAAPGDGA